MTTDRPKRLRCAIYTRKSSEEGLDQAFNSLDAQRESCEAYIKSQAGEGWHLIRFGYDDGGVSGGTLDRPALQQLLADIKARRQCPRTAANRTDSSNPTRFFCDIKDLLAEGVGFEPTVRSRFETPRSTTLAPLRPLLGWENDLGETCRRMCPRYENATLTRRPFHRKSLK